MAARKGGGKGGVKGGAAMTANKIGTFVGSVPVAGFGARAANIVDRR